MHTSGSVLLTVIERIRGFLDEAILDAKVTDDYLVRHIIIPSVAEVVGRIEMTEGNPVLMRYDISLQDGKEHYTLPPTVGSVWRVATLDDEMRVISEMIPRGEYHLEGPSWSLEGNTISFRPLPASAETLTVFYKPTGEYLPHYATDGTLDEDGVNLTLSSSPSKGAVDRRVNAYGGQMLRILPTSGVIEERMIESHDPQTGTVRVRDPFIYQDPDPDVSSSSSGYGITVSYEIVPSGSQSMAEAISARGALKLGAYRNIDNSHSLKIQREYAASIKTLRDRLTVINMRRAPHYDGNTVDNQHEVAYVLV